MKVFCPDCGKKAEFDAHTYCCECGGAWEFEEMDSFDPSAIAPGNSGLWRYQDIFGLDEIEAPFTLGAGWTPVVDANFNSSHSYFKLEFMAPTGSFKDRGTEVEINFLRASGITEVVEDSSGNAGASIAAYAARAGIKASIYAPESASAAKLAQIGFFGADLHKIPGPRIETTKAALQAVSLGAVYAYTPSILYTFSASKALPGKYGSNSALKCQTRLSFRSGRADFCVGAFLGFGRLVRAGMINKLPKLFAAQPELLSPIHDGFFCRA